MPKGWHFKHGDDHYWVKASTAEQAKVFVFKKNEQASKTEPDAIPDALLDFFDLKRDGDIVAGRVYPEGA